MVGRAGALRVTSVGSLEDASELQDNVAACVPDVIEPVLPAAVTTPAAATNDLTAYHLYLHAFVASAYRRRANKGEGS